MKSFRIYIRPFYIIFLITQLFSSAETKLKLLENNQLIGEVSTIQNKNLISINDYIEITNSKNFINDKTEKIIFYIDDKKIKLTNQIPFIMIDDNLYQLSSNVIKSNNNYYVPAESFFSIVNNLSNTISITLNINEINFSKFNEVSKKTIKVDLRSEKEKWEFKTIVIDAGHGGKDPGAVGYKGTKEKDIALDVAKRLEKKLAKNMKVKIVMTRDEDIFLR